VFEFPKVEGLRLWVLPFCLKSRRLCLPHDAPFADAFRGTNPLEAAGSELSAVG